MRHLLGFVCNLYTGFEDQLIVGNISNFKDVQRLQLVFNASIQVTAITWQVVHHLTSLGNHTPLSPYQGEVFEHFLSVSRLSGYHNQSF